MLSEDITSGELYYRAEHELDQLPFAEKSRQGLSMKPFLGHEIDIADNSAKIRRARRLLLQSFSAKVQHVDGALLELLIHRIEQKVLLAHQEMQQVQKKLHFCNQRFDHCALQSVLQYASVLQQETIDAQNLLQQERLMKDSLNDQAKLTRELKLYSVHLKLETKSKIELVVLPSTSAQFIRCVKAVHDNLHNCFGFNMNSPMLPSPNNVNIINVFKLKNSYLAKALQKSASKAAGPKMKGLFCCMPIENIYRFTIQGLAEQAFPSSNDDRPLSDLSLYFTPPWIFADQQPLLPLSSEMMNVLDQAGFAHRAVSNRVARPVLRFSKYSTMSTLLSYSESKLNKGVCLALCRVLMVRVKTVSSFLQESDLLHAVQQGYDAVYSTISEEYALLQPNFVLPEFLIHTDFTSLRQSALLPTSQQSSDKSGLPLYLRIPPDNLKKIEIADPSLRKVILDPQLVPSALGLLHANKFNSIQAMNGLSNENEDDAARVSNGSPTKKENPQRNVMIKQSALLAIENAVEEFRRVIPLIFLDSANRLRSMI